MLRPASVTNHIKTIIDQNQHNYDERSLRSGLFLCDLSDRFLAIVKINADESTTTEREKFQHYKIALRSSLSQTGFERYNMNAKA